MFDLDDRLQLLAERLARKEAPERSGEREEATPAARRTLKPAEERADARAAQAVANMKDEERAPAGVRRARTQVADPGSAGPDPKLWRRITQQESAGGSDLPPDFVARFGDQLGEGIDDIQIHTDGAADQICRAAQSEIVARGRDVFFRRGTPLPGTAKGDQLLAQAVAQLSTDARTARDDQPLRAFFETEPDSETKAEPVEDPEQSGFGLLGLVGGLFAVKESHDRRREAKAQQADAELQRQRSETEKRAKAADGSAGTAALTGALQRNDSREDQEAAARVQQSETAGEDQTRLSELDASARNESKSIVKEMVDSAQTQLAEQQQMPEQLSDSVEARTEDLALFAAAATQTLSSLNDKDATRDEQATKERTDGGVDLDVGLDGPFDVDGNYRARWNQESENTEADQVDVADHELVMTTDVPDAAREFEEDSFGPDLSITVDRILEQVEDQIRSGETAEHEGDRLEDDIESRRDQLASVIEQRVRDAAEKNGDEQKAEEELRVELEAESSTDEAQQAEGDDSFTFGARIDLATGEVVVTTSDSIPTSAESAPAAAAPSIAGGGDGGGGAGSGGGTGGGSGGGGGGAGAA
jgi:hypothetical protein